MAAIILKYAVLLQSLFSVCLGIICFECNGTPNPRFCDTLTTCTTGEKCVVEYVVTSSGNLLYNTGCSSAARCSIRRKRRRATDITVCQTCCGTDFCNNEGCGAKDIARDQRGPYCLGCQYSLEPQKCGKVQFCFQHQKCSIQMNEPLSLTSGRSVYRQGCLSITHCDPKNGFCCDGDFCNTHYTGSLQTTTAATSSLTSSVSTLATNTAVTTSSRDQIVLRKLCDQQVSNGYFYDTNSNLCYKLYKNSSRPISQSQARLECQRDGTDLISLHNDGEMDALFYAIFSRQANDTSYWIGAGANVSEASTYHWIDGSPLDYQKWEHPFSGQPDYPWAPDEKCVYLNYRDKFRWHDDACNSLKTGYICEIGGNSTSNKRHICISHAFNGYLLEANMCVKLYTETNGRVFTWDIANGACRAEGGSLVTIDSNDKMDAILRLIFSNRANATNYWVGAIADPKSTHNFFWPTGTPVTTFTHWGGISLRHLNASQPDIPYRTDNERCVYMDYIHNYYWFDVNCDAKLNGYICQFVGRNNTEKECKDRVYSKDYWFDHVTNTCFALRTNAYVNKTEAKNLCKQDGSVLLSIKNSRILDVVLENIFFSHWNATNYWIDGFFDDKRGFIWENLNQPFSYTHWYKPEPMDCAVLDYRKQFMWAPRPCSSTTHGYICRLQLP